MRNSKLHSPPHRRALRKGYASLSYLNFCDFFLRKLMNTINLVNIIKLNLTLNKQYNMQTKNLVAYSQSLLHISKQFCAS